MDDSREHDVIIAGAGPVGLFLACELALATCTVLVLEKASDPHAPVKRLPFGIRGLSAPTIEALDRRDLLDELEIPKRLKNPHSTTVSGTGAQARRQGGHFAGIPFYDDRVDTSQWPDRLPSSTETSLISELEELETVLARRALASGVEIRYGLPITGVHQTAERVTVHCDDQSFHGRWLVGCDGARSVVRAAGGFDFAGTEPEFTGYSIQADLADAEKLAPGRNLTPRGMYFQSQPGYLVMVEFDSGAGHRPESLSLDDVQTALRRVANIDVTVSALHNVTTWTDRARQATTYRNGRTLVAGDAAHIHSPLGGQGLNLGLGDAMNLGWKLAATVHGHAPDGLLDTYTTERHPIGAQVLDWSRAQVAIMHPGPAGRALHAIVRDLMETRDGATYFAARVRGIFTHYDLGGEHPLVGHSAPNFAFDDGTTLDERMRDGRGLLLDFATNATLETFARASGDRMTYVAGHAVDQLGLSAALLRPDGIIAWAARNEPDFRSLEMASARWFG